VIKEVARACPRCRLDELFDIAARLEKVMWRHEEAVFPNLDWYSAVSYHLMGVPTAMFTPVFVMSRTSGWCAHVIEQRQTTRSSGRAQTIVGPRTATFVPLEDRD
jgi:2-methylcitrate synthase